jgi:hypothetical protein
LTLHDQKSLPDVSGRCYGDQRKLRKEDRVLRIGALNMIVLRSGKFLAINVCNGSKAEKLGMTTTCPLSPRKQTSPKTVVMSA